MQPSRPLIVASRTDQASFNIAQQIIQQTGITKQTIAGQQEFYADKNNDVQLLILGREVIYAETTDLPENPGPIIFVSKHRSNTDTPALTVHATGNLTSEALYGGRPEEVSFVEPFRLQSALTILTSEVKRLGLSIEVTMEATHHGPTSLASPVCFVEVGSGRDQWGDPVLGGVAAKAALAAAHSIPSTSRSAVGFGGTHYPSRLTKLNIEGAYQIGHVVSRYAFDRSVSDQVLRDTFAKTVGGCTTALVDWKGLKGEQRRGLLDKLSAWNIEPIRL